MKFVSVVSSLGPVLFSETFRQMSRTVLLKYYVFLQISRTALMKCLCTPPPPPHTKWIVL